MSKPWGGGLGTWAADVEREEREAAAAAETGGGGPNESQSFPSLKEAVTARSKKKKMTLPEFFASGRVGGGGMVLESKGLTPDEMLRLPTGPKERSPEEMQYGRLGGGFSSYGRTGPPMNRNRERGGPDESWGGGRRQFGGGFDEDRRGPPPSRVSAYDQPSRADEVDNWAKTKKPLPSFDSGPRQSRYGGLGAGGGGGGGGGFGGMSRADEVDNWGSGKQPVSIRSSSFGSGFRDSRPEPDRWGRGGGFESETRERPRLVLDPPKGDVGGNDVVKSNKPNPFGAARPREEVLAEKGLDWKKLEMELEVKKASAVSSRPTSAHSSRPSSAQSSRSDGFGLQQGSENVVGRTRPKVNPFGDAKPREVLLEERGQDWRKIDLELEHRAVDRAETEEEKLLKEEIDDLKKKLKKESPNGDPSQGSVGEEPSLQEVISQKEKELDILIRDLDAKVRFGPKIIERPGSGSGRSIGFSDRPLSRSESVESGNMEFMERPRSRGMQDSWNRPGNDRRAFQGSRDRGFRGSRDFDRQTSRERW